MANNHTFPITPEIARESTKIYGHCYQHSITISTGDNIIGCALRGQRLK